MKLSCNETRLAHTITRRYARRCAKGELRGSPESSDGSEGQGKRRTDQIGGNGFIAAFVGGLLIGPTVERVGERVMRFTEAEGQLLNLSVFFIFGVLVLGVIQPLSWEVALYALLSLTLIRMLPVALSLYGTHLRGVSILFAGWFGPRGLASIVLGLIVVEEAPLLPGRGEIEAVVALAVLLSVLLHGITAAPLSAVYARRVRGMESNAQEKQGTVEAPIHGGSVPPGIQRGG
jgi:NhaP-type Na+/H+ or K+/H+ antiporter